MASHSDAPSAKTVMMKCGHAANAVSDGKPACVICAPNTNALTVDDSPPLLAGRKSRCAYKPLGHNIVDSSPDLPFFEFQGEGSREAVDMCKCGYHRVAHEKGNTRCKTFTAKGAQQFDKHYCGCMGWD